MGLGSARETSLPAQPRVRTATSFSRATPSTGEGLELGVGVGVMGGVVVAWGPCSVDLVVFCVLWAFHVPRGWDACVGPTAVLVQSAGQEMPK